MRLIRRLIRRLARSLAFAAVLALVAPAAAQDSEPAPEAPAEAQGPVRPSGAAYMAPMGRLAGILGSVHFLRTLCGDENASVWREKMNELIEAQKPNEADRRILIAQFNGGYRAFESTYRQCTPAAEVATRRYLEEGATLSREISARFGN
jgi:uncharacterized protein (TIGR02301 family)